jgi:tRNA(Ile)-lysidine synthase TilS/MesJ
MLRRKLGRKMGTTMRDYGLLQDGDKVMVCVSGGKDSYSLLDLMWEHKQRAPVKYDLVAVHLDQGQPGLRRRAAAHLARGVSARPSRSCTRTPTAS